MLGVCVRGFIPSYLHRRRQAWGDARVMHVDGREHVKAFLVEHVMDLHGTCAQTLQ